MKQYNPTSPGRRQMSAIEYKKILSGDKPYRSLLAPIKSTGGRNNRGRITVRWRGGGHKRLFRDIDFNLTDKKEIPGKIETIEYDPFRSAFISRVLFKDGERRYILSPDGIKIGDETIVSENAELKIGNRIPLNKIPVGTQVFNIEFKSGRGGRLARSAGSYAQVAGIEGEHAYLKMPSSEIRKVRADCWATIGIASNADHMNVTLGKAGKSRWMGRRPHVRGTAMNAVDHPHGGGEGRAPRGSRRPKDKWGKVTGGRKTRKTRKYSQRLIMQRRTK